MAVRIITDSGCDIVGADNPQLDVLPLSITFGSTVYADGVDLSHEHFYELLVEGDELPKTGQVNPYAFAQAIERAEHDGFEPLIITLSAKLSGTYQSACMAASEASLPVRVVDSGHVTVSERILVEYALGLAKKGLGVEEIATRVEAARERVVVIGLLDTLEYLRRGGRISAAAGAFGEMLYQARHHHRERRGQDARPCAWLQERPQFAQPADQGEPRYRLLHAGCPGLCGSFGRLASKVHSR